MSLFGHMFVYYKHHYSPIPGGNFTLILSANMIDHFRISPENVDFYVD